MKAEVDIKPFLKAIREFRTASRKHPPVNSHNKLNSVTTQCLLAV